MEKIICAAIKTSIIHSVPQPLRHSDIMCSLDFESLRNAKQGFLTNEGRFVNRIEAFNIAKAAGQIIHKDDLTNELYTEDMW